jgi:four helix bundle protein
MSGSYHDLKVWQKAMELVTDVYSLTRAFPKEELYGLAIQLRRAAVSVPSNIAEGKGRCSDKELLVSLHHARGSVFEVETQLLLARQLNDLMAPQAEKATSLAGEVARMLNGLIDSLKAPEGGSRLQKLATMPSREKTGTGSKTE